MKKIHWFALLLSVLFLSVTLTGCQSSTASGTEEESHNDSVEEKTDTIEKKDLSYAIANDVDGFDPHRTVSASTFQITNNIYDTLIGVTPGGELEPRLATKWEYSEDGLEWTFTLASDVVFHNDQAFTAEDVVYSFERIKSEEGPRAGDYQNIVDVTAVNEGTLKITLEKPDATFLSSLAMPWTAIVPNGSGEELKSAPVGTGAYQLIDWMPQESIALQYFDQYHGEQPAISEVTFKVIPEASTLLANLETGQIDIGAVGGENVQQVENSSNLKIFTAAQNNVQVLAMNNSVEPLNDLRVRQAISKAINKEEVIEGANWGYGEAIGSHMSPTSPYYSDMTDVLSHDVEEAKQLLEEAGYGDGFSISLSLPENYAIHVSAGQIIADQLKQIGIDVEIEMVEWGSWLEGVYANRQYDMTVISHTGRLDPDAMIARYQTDSGENYFNYANALVDEKIKAGRAIMDEAERKEAYSFILETLAEEVPAVYLQAPSNIMAMNKNIQGLEVYPIDIINLKDIRFEQ